MTHHRDTLGTIPPLSLEPFTNPPPPAGHATLPPTSGPLRSVPPPPPSLRMSVARFQGMLNVHLGGHPLHDTVERCLSAYRDEALVHVGLLNVAEARPELLKELIAQVTRCEVREMIFASDCTPGPAIGIPFAERIREAQSTALDDLHTPSQIARARNDVRETMRYAVTSVIDRKCGGRVSEDLKRQVVEAVLETMSCLLLRAMADECDGGPMSEDLFALSGLLTAMLGTPVLGEWAELPGFWTALTR